MSPAENGGEHHAAGFLSLPNILSLVRIPLGVTFLAVDDPKWLAVVVAGGAATDLLDGWLARQTGQTSEMGALLDPFCDRIFVFLGLVSFLPTAHLDWAGFLILILRDIFTGGVYLVGRLAGQHLPFHSRQGGRVTTALQMGALFALIFLPDLVMLMILLVGIAAVYSIIDYGEAGIRQDGARHLPEHTTG